MSKPFRRQESRLVVSLAIINAEIAEIEVNIDLIIIGYLLLASLQYLETQEKTPSDS